MKNKEKIIKEINKWKQMLKEEEGSLWASENETYMEEKRQLLKDLKNQLKGYNKSMKDFADEIKKLKDAPKSPDYPKVNSGWSKNWEAGYDAALYALGEYTE